MEGTRNMTTQHIVNLSRAIAKTVTADAHLWDDLQSEGVLRALEVMRDVKDARGRLIALSMRQRMLDYLRNNAKHNNRRGSLELSDSANHHHEPYRNSDIKLTLCVLFDSCEMRSIDKAILIQDSEGYTSAESAEILHISQSMVKSSLCRQRSKLSQVLAA